MLIIKILENLLEAGESITDAMFSGYAESYRKMRGINNFHKINKTEYEKLERHRFNSLLSKLRSKGFIQKSKTNNKIFWHITKKGAEKLNILKQKDYSIKSRVVLPLNQKDFLKVVIFDIPEIYRKKRNWLRFILTNLGFQKLQKSVWLGDEKLPEDFLDHLKELKLMPYIHIFAINKKGSLNAENL